MTIAVVTAISRFTRFAPEFMFSCLRHGIQPIILTDCPTWGVAKTECYHRWIKSDAAKAFTHVLFCDGYDVIFQSDLDMVKKHYAVRGKPLLIGAEPFCTRHTQYADKFPKVVSGLRYPNCGMWMAERELAESLLDNMLARKQGDCDETSLLLPALLDLDPELWAVDSDCFLFLNWSESNTMTFNEKFRAFVPDKFPHYAPCLIHFPGFDFPGLMAQFTKPLGFPAR